ncbi:MAG: site-specific integrase [Oceanococcus sp.]|nr:MAG: site-specific integrase [Oceanococcus sp.]
MPAKVRSRGEPKKLYFDFQYRGKRCREYTALDDTKANRKRVEAMAKKIDAEMVLGTFDYAKYFPDSPRAAEFAAIEAQRSGLIPQFKEFASKWIEENRPRWRIATLESNIGSINRHLMPAFGETRMDVITRENVLDFRAELAKLPGRNGNVTLSGKTINHTVGVLSSILDEAGRRYNFSNPCAGIKRVKQQKADIEPFTLDETQLLINNIRADYKNYLVVRFFTGMRTAEINGLKWRYVDFDRAQILIRESFHHGRVEQLKTTESMREIDMSAVITQALKEQAKATQGVSDYVFCTRKGTPLDTKNFTDRVWYPLLDHLGLRKRRPYQTRHTAATLWLVSGENPEWIARQLGHSNTEMLFRVYSRYVPNATRRDGSAMDQLLSNRFGLDPIAKGSEVTRA